MTGFAVGVDGGGTRTRAVVLDEVGSCVGRAEGDAAAADAVDPGPAAEAVAGVCRTAARAAGIELPVDALWAGLAGAGREAARSAVEAALGHTGVARVVHVGTDVEAAFHDAFPKGPGVLLIAGTGSIAWGRAENGREGRAGGWGHHIGDEGSGYAIGLDALRAVVRDADGRGPKTALSEAILEHLGVSAADDLVRWTAAAQRADLAALAPVVATVATAGDAAAREIVEHAVEELAHDVLAVLEKLGPWRVLPHVALAGGLLRAGRSLRKPLEAALARHGVPLLEREIDPAMGAGRLACEIVV